MPGADFGLDSFRMRGLRRSRWGWCYTNQQKHASFALPSPAQMQVGRNRACIKLAGPGPALGWVPGHGPHAAPHFRASPNPRSVVGHPLAVSSFFHETTVETSRSDSDRKVGNATSPRAASRAALRALTQSAALSQAAVLAMPAFYKPGCKPGPKDFLYLKVRCAQFATT